MNILFPYRLLFILSVFVGEGRGVTLNQFSSSTGNVIAGFFEIQLKATHLFPLGTSYFYLNVSM